MNRRKFAAVMGGVQYWQRIRALYGASLIRLWGLEDLSGTRSAEMVANDLGTYQGDASLAAAVNPIGKKAPTFSGLGDIYSLSTAISNAWSKNDFTVFALIKNNDYQSVGNEYVCQISADANNYASLYKEGAGVLKFALKTNAAAPTPSYYDSGILSSMGWFLASIKFTYGSVFGFSLNGCKVDVLSTGSLPPVAWVTDGLNAFRIGAFNGSYSSGWKGAISTVGVLNRASTDTEDRRLYKIFFPSSKIISVLGDSISQRSSINWTSYLQAQYNSGNVGVRSHAVGGHKIVDNMDAQTVAAATDDADIIIVALGTNDTVTDDTLRAEYEENLNELKVSNPRALIYGMGILPRTDTTNVATKNGRISTACTNAGITYWDTTGWIDPSTETSDGTHPTAAGHAKIATQVLARLP